MYVCMSVVYIIKYLRYEINSTDTFVSILKGVIVFFFWSNSVQRLDVPHGMCHSRHACHMACVMCVTCHVSCVSCVMCVMCHVSCVSCVMCHSWRAMMWFRKWSFCHTTTHDTWHMTHDTWHMTHDIWHMTHDTTSSCSIQDLRYVKVFTLFTLRGQTHRKCAARACIMCVTQQQACSTCVSCRCRMLYRKL
jgi:hypothetical protein